MRGQKLQNFLFGLFNLSLKLTDLPDMESGDSLANRVVGIGQITFNHHILRIMDSIYKGEHAKIQFPKNQTMVFDVRLCVLARQSDDDRRVPCAVFMSEGEWPKRWKFVKHISTDSGCTCVLEQTTYYRCGRDDDWVTDEPQINKQTAQNYQYTYTWANQKNQKYGSIIVLGAGYGSGGVDVYRGAHDSSNRSLLLDFHSWREIDDDECEFEILA